MSKVVRRTCAWFRGFQCVPEVASMGKLRECAQHACAETKEYRPEPPCVVGEGAGACVPSPYAQAIAQPLLGSGAHVELQNAWPLALTGLQLGRPENLNAGSLSTAKASHVLV